MLLNEYNMKFYTCHAWFIFGKPFISIVHNTTYCSNNHKTHCKQTISSIHPLWFIHNRQLFSIIHCSDRNTTPKLHWSFHSSRQHCGIQRRSCPWVLLPAVLPIYVTLFLLLQCYCKNTLSKQLRHFLFKDHCCYCERNHRCQKNLQQRFPVCCVLTYYNLAKYNDDHRGYYRRRNGFADHANDKRPDRQYRAHYDSSNSRRYPCLQ